MHLHLGNNPRTLYLITDEKDELLGRPRRALRFRLGQDRSQAIVALLPTREVDQSNLVKLTNRTVKGCLGLISVDNGVFQLRFLDDVSRLNQAVQTSSSLS
jgi:hypothetical protein